MRRKTIMTICDTNCGNISALIGSAMRTTHNDTREEKECHCHREEGPLL
ncbi:MAG: hypothetical protein JWR36_1901 [Glaciihabitans sp.]|jgi:hypothetical protein|nr:hypothetical protein [Glaciihabitans sp.]MDQ1569373.1 hypothetical protein [Actinomycetota bacterium]